VVFFSIEDIADLYQRAQLSNIMQIYCSSLAVHMGTNRIKHFNMSTA